MDISPEDIVVVYQAANAPEAHVVCSMLEDAGLKSHVVDEQEPFGGVPSVAAASVVVHRRDEARALQLIEEYEAAHEESDDDEDDDDEDWSE